MYINVKADSWIPQLEKVMEEAQLKWVDLAQERVT